MTTPKLCECGCGQPTPPSKSHNPKYGYVKGEPLRFIPGHQARGRKWTEERRRAFCESQRGHPVSAETRRKMSEYNKAHGVQPPPGAWEKSMANRGLRDKHASWKGGVSMVNGYRCVYQPEHPRRHPNGYVYEHIVVAEAKLGRPLAAAEVVHHIDGDKLNNHPDNLQVLANQSEHAKLHAQQRKAAKRRG